MTKEPKLEEEASAGSLREERSCRCAAQSLCIIGCDI